MCRQLFALGHKVSPVSPRIQECRQEGQRPKPAQCNLIRPWPGRCIPGDTALGFSPSQSMLTVPVPPNTSTEITPLVGLLQAGEVASRAMEKGGGSATTMAVSMTQRLSSVTCLLGPHQAVHLDRIQTNSPRTLGNTAFVTQCGGSVCTWCKSHRLMWSQ